MLEQYREAISQFHTRLLTEQFLYHSGQKNQLELYPIYDRFADLFTPDAIGELDHRLTSIPDYFTRQRKGIRLLIGYAQTHYINKRTYQLTEQLAKAEKQAMLHDGRELVSLYAAVKALATEADARHRRHLHQQYLDWLARTNELRQQQWHERHAAAQSLGYADYESMRASHTPIDRSEYLRAASRLLQETESVYFDQLDHALPNLLGLPRGQATQADLPYFLHLPSFAPQFPEDGLLAVYREIQHDLGIDRDKATNIRIDAHERVGKRPWTRTFPARIPDEIHLSVSVGSGLRHYQCLLHEAGRAQRYAWMSPTLLIEFRVCGDPALLHGFGFLFEYLTLDRVWLEQMLHIVKSSTLITLGWLQKLLLIRQAAATVPVEQTLHTAGDWSATTEQYAQCLTDATGFRHDGDACVDVLHDDDSAIDRLRGWLFEAALRERLKTRYGTKWWTSKKAADMLIDLWSSGGEYTAEELASLADLGTLSFDQVISECTRSLKRT
ncbi:MAG: hypothetical protein NZ823_15705 [Blastocatellia bacterium]|nr:hypothetical protein [Blastocatellia bacterium]